MTELFVFEPYLKPALWGGDKIAIRKGLKAGNTPIGESWEISGVSGHESVVAQGPDKGLTLIDLIHKYGESLLGKRVHSRYGDKFPLLIKFIDAQSNLSVQVHPDDAMAMARHNSMGKTEMWYILESKKDAKIYAGLSKPITPDEYDSLVTSNNLMSAIKAYDAGTGDLYYLPAGSVHAIGAGNLLVEIQQSSDITYRIYDYGRLDADGHPRELHTELAKDAIDYDSRTRCRVDYDETSDGNASLLNCKYFKVNKVAVNGDADIMTSSDSFTILICVKGKAAINAGDSEISVFDLREYSCILIPAGSSAIRAEGSATLLTVTV